MATTHLTGSAAVRRALCLGLYQNTNLARQNRTYESTPAADFPSVLAKITEERSSRANRPSRAGFTAAPQKPARLRQPEARFFTVEPVL
jgi:hypothetical protein